MINFKINRKGQFSIIAALLVAIVLVAAVMTTYASIRYSTLQDNPQMLSAVDEVNLALKKILGFTVGYYGSVLQVTGNTSYAKMLALRYLSSGLSNIADVRPECSPSFTVTSVDLKTNWFTNTSYSSGNFAVKYDLGGIGVYGLTYSTSSRLDVQIVEPSSSNQAALNIFKDENEPLLNLGIKNFKFYKYLTSNSTWELVGISNEPLAFANGTYLIDLPSGINSSSYVIKIEDTRGLTVVASTFSKYTSTLAWNTTFVPQDLYYVDNANLNVKGTHSNFTAQQYGPDSVYDTLTEAANGTTLLPSYPTSWNTLGSTTFASGTINNLQSNNGVYLSFRSYGSAFAGSANFGYATQGGSTSALDVISGSRFTIPQAGLANSMSAYLSSTTAFKAKAAIYSSDGSTLIGTTEEKVFNNANGWVTFNFVSPPILAASTDYVLVVWSNSSNVNIYRYTGTAQRFQATGTYPTWPTSVANQDSQRTYSIYCTYSPATQYTAAVEFTGSSNAPIPWNNLVWAIDSSASASGITASLQLYNWGTGQYPSSGDGYMTATLGTSDSLNLQTITTNPASFLNSSGYWKVNVTAVKSTSTQFDLKLDLVQYSPEFPNYALNLEEQWININATNLRQDLCIKTGDMGVEPLVVQVLHDGSWNNLMTLVPNYFNNVSLAPYIDSTTLTIRFIGSNDATDPTQDSWNIDSVYIKHAPDISFLVNLQESTFTLEVLQNGTMRWIGQNLQLTTETLPIPPIPVKAIHVNQTINGVNQEVPFQIEDWASEYRIPLGLTSNTTVFSNKQMIVFLLNSKVTDFTIWWDGSDEAVQTQLAYTNRYFSDNVNINTLNNSRQRLQFSTNGFTLTSTVGSVTSTAKLMRINTREDSTEPELSYVISNGVVRDIVLGEAEYSGGIATCPNIYTNIVITLPANVTYYTYQLRLMFISSVQSRSISDMCPIRVSTSASSVQLQTENSTLAGFPLVQNGTGTFLNYTSSSWTAHHFSQFISDTGKGAGIMFTDTNNQKLYAFDSFSGSSSKGALKASSGLLELLPVSSPQVQFTHPYDITWQGAVATFDNTTPICNLYDGTTPMGLWILAEYPPTITVTAKS
jgi:hypothetical protein